MIPASEVPYSPGWYFKTLFNQLCDHRRRERFELLRNYRIGKAPLPRGAENARSAYESFCQMARTNFADLITSALAERMRVTGFASATDNDETGDPEIGSLWTRAGLNVISGDVHKEMLSLSEFYVCVGNVDPDIDAAVVTAEDPLFIVGMPDPALPQRLIAALKVKHDVADDVDRAYLYLAGKVFAPGARAQIWVAERRTAGALGPMYGFYGADWTWSPARSSMLPHDRVPVVRFDNADKLGEYEPHLDHLDRINHQILQRMTVAVMQAFKQRAVMGLPKVYPDTHPKAGQEIDYGDVFISDPAAVWHLPPGVTMWESGMVDLTPIISAISADVQHLASASRTPLHMMQPAGDNQSAEGATLQREGLTFKAADRIERTSFPWTQTVALMLLHAGATDLKALARLRPIWANPELLSLSERADAASKAANDIPLRSRLVHIWGFPGATVDRMLAERADELVLAQQVANALATAAPVAIGAAPATPAAPQQQPAPAALPAGAGAAA